MQCAKNVLSNSPGGLVDSVCWEYNFEEIQITDLKCICTVRDVFAKG